MPRYSVLFLLLLMRTGFLFFWYRSNQLNSHILNHSQVSRLDIITPLTASPLHLITTWYVCSSPMTQTLNSALRRLLSPVIINLLLDNSYHHPRAIFWQWLELQLISSMLNSQVGRWMRDVRCMFLMTMTTIELTVWCISPVTHLRHTTHTGNLTVTKSSCKKYIKKEIRP